VRELQKQLAAAVASGGGTAGPCKGHTEEIARQRAEIEKLMLEIRRIAGMAKSHKEQLESAKKQCEEMDVERGKMVAEIASLREEMEKANSEGEMGAMRKLAAEQRLKIAELDMKLMKVADPLNKRIKSLESELSHGEESRRQLQASLRKMQNDADTTYAAPPPRPAAKPRPLVAIEPPDTSSAGIVGQMILARSETEMAVLREQNTRLQKTVDELKAKLVEYRLKYPELKRHYEAAQREIKELQSHEAKHRGGSDAGGSGSPQPRPPLSPRQDKRTSSVPEYDGSAFSAGTSGRSDRPDNCKQQ
jgi:chromosome segregation ATPase